MTNLTLASKPGQRVYSRRETCRACGLPNPRPFLSLGQMPLANSFLRSPEEFVGESRYPLDVYYCRNCSLVQLLDVIDPEVLFRNYIYLSGTSETIAAHYRQYAHTLSEHLQLRADDLVLEVASNDGSLLNCFTPYGVRTLGVEPASNIAAMARVIGIETINEFFSSATAQQIRKGYGPARVVIANNVLAHVDETQDFLRGCRSLIEGDSLVVFEVPYLGDLVDRLEYDTIYHEHLCYFSISSLLRVCEASGLVAVRVDRVPVHGGSIRVYAGLPGAFGSHAHDVAVMVQAEQRRGLTDFSRFERFAAQVEDNRQALRALLEGLIQKGKTVAGYGAPAKGNTLLNYCQIDAHFLPYTVDKSSMKVGLYLPGVHIPVLPVSTLVERQPDYVLILAWNFADEIIRQQQAYRNNGGHFIIPIPEPRLV